MSAVIPPEFQPCVIGGIESARFRSEEEIQINAPLDWWDWRNSILDESRKNCLTFCRPRGNAMFSARKAKVVCVPA